MSIFADLFRRNVKPAPVQEERGIGYIPGLMYNSLSSYQYDRSMQLSAVYCATNMISNSVAMLPMHVVQYVDGRKQEIDHPLNKILNLIPDKKHNKFSFFKLLIESVILNGNGYAYIVRDSKLNIKSLELLDPAFVRPIPQADGRVKYQIQGMDTLVDAENMIHLYQHIDDQFCGISTLRYAIKCLESAADTDAHARKFFQSGAGMVGVLQATAPLTDKQKEQAAESWRKTVMRGNGVAVLPQGLSFQSVQVNPDDAQLLDSRKYSVVEIARFFNISPIKLFDYEHVSYNTLEQVDLSYLQETILPFTQMMEDEFNKKLFKPSEIGKLGVDFDYAAIMTTDKKSEAEYYRTLLTNGIMSVNEVRDKLGYEPVEGDFANTHWIQISYGNAEQISQGAYIKQTAQDQNQNIDNKVTEKPAKKTKKNDN